MDVRGDVESVEWRRERGRNATYVCSGRDAGCDVLSRGKSASLACELGTDSF